MPFTARIKADGRFFIGSTEVMSNDDERTAPSKLQPGKRYKGLVFDSTPTLTHYVEFSQCTLGDFNSDELEDIPGNIRMIGY